MGPLSNEIVLVIVIAAVLVGIYLLRHIIAFAFKLIVFAGLVLAGIWVWQHRAELVDAVEPYLGPIGDRLESLDLSDVRNRLADLLSDEESSTAEDTGATDIIDVIEESGVPNVPEESGSSADADEEPDDLDNPDNPE